MSGRRALEGAAAAGRQAALELGHVGREAVPRQRHRLALGCLDQALVRAEPPAEVGERLAQAGPRLRLAAVAPEQAGELVATLRLALPQSKVGEQQGRHGRQRPLPQPLALRDQPLPE